MSALENFTVVLLRPDYIANVYGQDVYVTNISASAPEIALDLAQTEACQADIDAGLDPITSDDYALCVMFEGNCVCVLRGDSL